MVGIQRAAFGTVDHKLVGGGGGGGGGLHAQRERERESVHKLTC